MSELEKLFELAKTNVARIFAETGEIVPMWHIVLGNGQNAIGVTPWADDEEKDAMIQVMRETMTEQNAQRYVFMCEAWTVAVRELPKVRPSKHPDRREVLRVQAEDRDGTAMSGHFYILRPEHGPAKLSPFHLDAFDGKAEGRLVGLLH